MELLVPIVMLSVGVVVLIAAILWNRFVSRHRARRRLEQTGDAAARHLGSPQSQRGRVYKKGSTYRSANRD